jgi:hypothetical protein
MTPAEWAEVFRAGWNDSDSTRNTPAGEAVANALHAMELKAREISERNSHGDGRS